MDKGLERVSLVVTGIAAGIMVAVIYLRYFQANADSLDYLRDGALILLGLSLIIRVLPVRPKTESR